MSIKRFALATLLAITCISLASTAAQANCDCIDNLTHQLMPQVRQMEREYVATFRGSHQFNHGLNDVKEVANLAAHFHETAHRKADPAHLRSDIEKLERAYHHLESVVGRMEREVSCQPQSFRIVMAKVGGTIHKLEEMVVRGCGCGVPGRGPSAGQGPGHAPVAPVAPPQRGFRFGNERFGFLFRW